MTDVRTETERPLVNDTLTDTRKAENALNKLKYYCEKEGFKGYDPYDGLNSRFFRSIPFISRNRFARLIWTQAFKKSPLNLRPLTGVGKEYNPKGLGLFLSGYCNLFKLSPSEHYLDKIYSLSARILELQSRNWSGACWGYNFDWQARAFFQPKYTPTVVATTFTACALLDAYELTGDNKLISIVRSSCDFILKDLNRTYEGDNFAFSYSPLDKSVVFNASLLASRLLARVYSITNESELADGARKSVNFCCNHQKEDGSWAYGQQPYHQWIDNFHTGYNLECLSDYMYYTGDQSFRSNFQKGMKFYLETFFRDDGMPLYYSNSEYPVDIHSSAQLLVTLTKTDRLRGNIDLANKVLNWTIDHMQSQKGYFYFQINKLFSSRIPYMRWAQAWMFYALSCYLYRLSRLKTDS